METQITKKQIAPETTSEVKAQKSLRSGCFFVAILSICTACWLWNHPPTFGWVAPGCAHTPFKWHDPFCVLQLLAGYELTFAMSICGLFLAVAGVAGKRGLVNRSLVATMAVWAVAGAAHLAE